MVVQPALTTSLPIYLDTDGKLTVERWWISCCRKVEQYQPMPLPSACLPESKRRRSSKPRRFR